jgi:hypothetical protein
MFAHQSQNATLLLEERMNESLIVILDHKILNVATGPIVWSFSIPYSIQ